MKYIIVLLACSMLGFQMQAQKKSATPNANVKPKMSTAEFEALKKKMLSLSSMDAREIAAAGNLKLDDMLLPDFKIQLPPKDLKRLALIPQQPPTLIQLSDGLRASKKQLETVTPKSIVEEVKKITATQTPEVQHGASVAAYYNDDPVKALLIAMNAAIQNPSETMGWNNLAAIMNMSGLEHKAVPILMNQLQTNPNNSMLLNNMGQAYLGLGEIGMAEMFLKKCLDQDPMHPEANRAMGMIKFAYNQMEEGMQYFEKELEIAMRRSTIGLMRGKNAATNLYRLRKKRASLPQRNYFAELQLSKFIIPALPENTDQTKDAKIQSEGFNQSVLNEMMYWNGKAQLSDEEIDTDGKKMPGLYSNLAEALLDDLHKVYTPEELSLFSDLDLNQIKLMLDDYGTKITTVNCPPAPAGATYGEYEAYIKKCCDIKKPIMDAFVAQYNAFVTSRANHVIPVWKDYINDLINIVSLDPSAGNKILVYRNLQHFFSLLATCYGSGQFLDPPMECSVSLSTAEADSVIESSRNLDLSCPQWLNIEFDVVVAKMKADCNKFGIEAGKLLQGAYEHNFRTGTTTLSAGVGVKAKFFANTGSAEIKQMLYVSFDNNNNFSDFGLLGKAGVKIGDTPINVAGGKEGIGGTLIGIEGGYTLGIHSGWKPYVKGTGILTDFIKIDKPL